MNTLSISRIKLKLHFVHNLRLTQKLDKKGSFAKVSESFPKTTSATTKPYHLEASLNAVIKSVHIVC